MGYTSSNASKVLFLVLLISYNDKKKSINQSVDLSINQSINQANNQPTNQLINRSIIQSINQSINQSLNQSIHQSINQLINQSIAINSLILTDNQEFFMFNLKPLLHYGPQVAGREHLLMLASMKFSQLQLMQTTSLTCTMML